MMGKTHSAAGMLFVAAGVPPITSAVGIDVGPGELLVGVGIGAIAGVLPDIDHPKSLITHGLVPGFQKLGPIAKFLGYILSIPPRLVGIPARASMNHRGGTHSLTFCFGWALLAAPFYALCAAAAAFLLSLIYTPLQAIIPFLPSFQVGDVVNWLWAVLPSIMPIVSISVFLGYLSHLITDSMTNVPVPWFWPFSKKRFSILPKGLRITTDSFAENILIRPVIYLLLLVAIVFNIGLPVANDLIKDGKEAIEKRQDDSEAEKKKEQQKKKQQRKKQQKKKQQRKKQQKKKQQKKKQQEKKNNNSADKPKDASDNPLSSL